MAFSVAKYADVSSRPFLITRSVITLDDEVNGDVIAVPHNGPDGRDPLFVLFRPVAVGSDCPTVAGYSYDTANGEVDINLGQPDAVNEDGTSGVTAADDYEDATIEMLCFFVDVAPANRT
jgi:hypothetical protein